MTTLDMIATHTNTVVSEVAAAQAAAEQAQAEADAGGRRRRRPASSSWRSSRPRSQKQVAAVPGRLRPAHGRRAGRRHHRRRRRGAAGAARNLPAAPGAAGAIAIETALAQVGDRVPARRHRPGRLRLLRPDRPTPTPRPAISLPHSSRAQSQLGTQVSRAELQPGDLVFFYSPISHVGLYIGNGMMVHARTYGSPVAVTSVDQRGYRFGVRLG